MFTLSWVMGKTEVWSNDLRILTGRVTLDHLFPDCSLNGKVREGVRWGDQEYLTAAVIPDLWLD